jgi:mannosyltransferase
MRDHDIAYGSNKANLEPLHLPMLSQHVREFLEKHSDLLHAEADMAWLLGSSDARHAHRNHINSVLAQHRQAISNGMEHVDGKTGKN